MFEKEEHRKSAILIILHQEHMLSMQFLTLGVELGHRRRQYLSGSPMKVTPALLSILYPLEGSHFAEPTSKEWGTLLPLLEGGVSTNIIWDFFLAWELCPFLFIYLANHVFMSVWTQG